MRSEEINPKSGPLGREIRRVREQAGLSPFDLGVAIGLPESEILAYEAGRRAISVPSLRAIALVCGTSTARLLANHPMATTAPNTPLWQELGKLFAQMDRTSRQALVRHARQLLNEEKKR